MSEVKSDSKANNKFEVRCGIVLSIFAALLAMVNLYGGKYKEAHIKALNEKVASFLWYQSKSIKETTIQGQKGILEALMSSGSIAGDKAKATELYLQKLSESSVRYKKEMKEILEGSKAVGKENWVQDVDGKLGQVTGANEWESMAEVFNHKSDLLDSAALFLQLCLVVGAVSIVVQNDFSRRMFYYFTLFIGSIGAGIATMSFF